jgi:hypothetical protein
MVHLKYLTLLLGLLAIGYAPYLFVWLAAYAWYVVDQPLVSIGLVALSQAWVMWLHHIMNPVKALIRRASK